MIGEIVNWAVLAIAILLFVLVTLLVRPANGSRPLLVGFAASSLLGIAIGFIRVFALQSQVRPWFGFVILAWLLVKMWALGSVMFRHPPHRGAK